MTFRDPLPKEFAEICSDIVTAVREVRKELGAGLVERVYRAALRAELRSMGRRVASEVPVTAEYKGLDLGEVFMIDELIDGKVVVECKALIELPPIAYAQTLTYLRLSKHPVAMLVNFNALPLGSGIHRFLNGPVAEPAEAPNAGEPAS